MRHFDDAAAGMPDFPPSWSDFLEARFRALARAAEDAREEDEPVGDEAPAEDPDGPDDREG
jgi:hypothetical protein